MGDSRSRRYRLGTGLLATLAAAALVAAGCTTPNNSTGTGTSVGPSSNLPAKPSAPIANLNVLDVAGNAQLTKGIFDDYTAQHPDFIQKVTISTEKAPNLAGKLKAQEDADQLNIDLVLTGTDGLSAGIAGGLYQPIGGYADRLGNMKNYTDPAAKMQDLAQGQAVELVEYPSGPLLEYDPSKVTSPPTSSDELLAWCQAHPGKFQYAQPANSGPGRTLLMGLPYLLGDSDPKDPTNGWSKTWDYMTQIGKCSAPYETGTGNTMKNLANGSVWMIASTTGWFINPKVLGTVPATEKFTTMKGFHWVTDAQYAAIPKGISQDKLVAILSLLNFMLEKKEQAITYDKGYFYPGPAVKDVKLSDAPQASQDAISKFGDTSFDDLIANNPQETSLPADKQVIAFALWNTKIGATKK
jgi:putative spermidine/putrescine transport system substrate-binding protein